MSNLIEKSCVVRFEDLKIEPRRIGVINGTAELGLGDCRNKIIWLPREKVTQISRTKHGGKGGTLTLSIDLAKAAGLI